MKYNKKKLKAKVLPTVPRYRYTAVKENVYVESIGVCKTYGIVCICITPAGERPCMIIHDVSTNRKVATQIAKCFTEQNLAACHFQDVIDDTLSTCK